jgi:16S rRNA (guanine(966)-N(2))-methyltransferase RsmD
VRIISGSAKGKRLSVLTGMDIRPTSDRVREAVFSILLSRFGTLDGCAVLDLFSGTGALSLEALSRGASRATLIDSGDQASRLIPRNISVCAFQQKTSFLRGDVLATLPRLSGQGPFDLIFLDPPYGRGLVPVVIASVARQGLLAPEGLIIAETARKDPLPAIIETMTLLEIRCYGSIAIHLFSHAASEGN